jgi:hypothetical protein
MSEQEQEGPAPQANFGEEPQAVAAAESSGEGTHRPGYVEAPSQVPEAAREKREGAARPQRLKLSED